MDGDRRYQDDEVREIFALASSHHPASTPALSAPQGLSLDEIQEAGREAGLAADRIADAARTVATRREVQPRGTTLGLPTRVGRIVRLPQTPTDGQWEMLVADMAHTFGGVGTVSGEGNLRQWTNGSVHVFLEPTPEGHRLRLTASNPGAPLLFGGAGLGLGMGTFFLVVILASGKSAGALAIPGLFLLAGVVSLLINLSTGGRWADEIERQMEEVAGRARTLLRERGE